MLPVLVNPPSSVFAVSVDNQHHMILTFFVERSPEVFSFIKIAEFPLSDHTMFLLVAVAGRIVAVNCIIG
jgi:hypothetical protein